MRAACDLDPRAIPPRLFLARIYIVNGKLADAENTYKGLKSIAPDQPEAYQALGTFYVSTGQLEKAVSEFQAVVAAKPKDRAAKSHLVETLLDLNRGSQAAPLNQGILKEAPDYPPALVASARILLNDRQYDKAVAALQKAVKSDPNLARGYYFLGLAQQALGLTDMAKGAFSRALELEPQMALASAALAGLTRDHNEALRLADKALKSNPNLPSAHFAASQALLAKGDLQQGEAALEETLRRDPLSLPALTTLLSLRIRQGRVQEAAQRLSGLLQQNPQNPGLHFLLAMARFEMKDLERAESDVRQALALDPKTPAAYTLLANIDFARGDVVKAKANLRTAIAAYPRNLLNYMALVTQYEKEENWEEAKKLCQQAHEIDPTSPMVAAELAFLYLEHGGDINAALSLAQIAKQKMPDSPATADALGWAYHKRGSPNSAIPQLKEAVEKVPDNPIYHYHLGMAYMAAQRPDLAGQSLRTALKVHPDFRYAANARAALDEIARRPRSRSGS
jgi:tetratricopeptide (TPR) repeat protein